MIIFKSVIVISIFVLGIYFIINTSKWSIKLQKYFVEQATSVFGHSFGWDKKMGAFVM